MLVSVEISYIMSLLIFAIYFKFVLPHKQTEKDRTIDDMLGTLESYEWLGCV